MSARLHRGSRRERRRRIAPAALVAVFALGLFSLTRAILLVAAGTDLVPLAAWPTVLVKGAWFDGCVVAVLVMPLLLYAAVRGGRRARSPRRRLVQVLGLASVTFALLFVAAAELTFWSEFQTRFNFIAVDYLIYTGEVIDNILESYPVAWIAAALALFALALGGAGTVLLQQAEACAPPPRRRVASAVLAAGLALTAIAFGDIDDMHGSGNPYADELSGNGLMTFAAALRRNELDYDRFYRTLPQRRADALLGELGVERAPLATALATSLADDPADDPLPFVRRPRNVVLLSVESLSAEFLGAYGSREGITPNLDRYARGGLKFERIYATGTRTVRGLEALSLGTPPVPGQARPSCAAPATPTRPRSANSSCSRA